MVLGSGCSQEPYCTECQDRLEESANKGIRRHSAHTALVNTGWTGGPYGVGSRMKLAYTRSMIRAALSGQLDAVAYETDPIFGLSVPTSCPDVPSDVLMPRNTWTDKAAYDAKARELFEKFEANYKKFV